eukprot:647692-Rhodomonas_salina.1
MYLCRSATVVPNPVLFSHLSIPALQLQVPGFPIGISSTIASFRYPGYPRTRVLVPVPESTVGSRWCTRLRIQGSGTPGTR